MCRGISYIEIPAEFYGIFRFSGIKLRNSVKFRGIPLNTDFRKIRIQPELFTKGIMDTLDGGLLYFAGIGEEAEV